MRTRTHTQIQPAFDQNIVKLLLLLPESGAAVLSCDLWSFPSNPGQGSYVQYNPVVQTLFICDLSQHEHKQKDFVST